MTIPSDIPPDVAKTFPNLNLMTALPKSERTGKYNCIAFAAGDRDQCWWPNEDGYWPEGVPCEETIEAFVAAYDTIGYSRCDSGELEKGFEKIAIYATPQSPSHAAVQLPDGKWKSKLGEYEDIQHDSLVELMIEDYGTVICFLKRPIREAGNE